MDPSINLYQATSIVSAVFFIIWLIAGGMTRHKSERSRKKTTITILLLWVVSLIVLVGVSYVINSK